jgi:hypothetical protein
MKYCKEHKRYKGKLRPKCDCVKCWQLFLEKTAGYYDVCEKIDNIKHKYDDCSTFIESYSDDIIIILKMLEEKKEEMEK